MEAHALVHDHVEARLRELRSDGERNRLARPLLAARRARRRARIVAALASGKRRLSPARDVEPVCCT
jgi:hypothetical protein